MKLKMNTLLATFLALSGCGESKKDSTQTSQTHVTPVGSIEIVLERSTTPALQLFAMCSSTSRDEPSSDVGEDCDSDGGSVAKQTPTKYQLAFKRFYVRDSAGETHDIIRFSRLADVKGEGIINFDDLTKSSYLKLPPEILAKGISAIGFELYYYQLQIKMYGADRILRIYMSDDNFETEGALGHHQGDITWFDTQGRERWAHGGEDWFQETPATLSRGTFANGDGGIDAETGHSRGMFGNADFWNASQHSQGNNADVYKQELAFTSKGFATTFKIAIKDTWFYEDFEHTYENSFDPCKNSSLEGCGGEWAPLLPTFSVESDATKDPSADFSFTTENEFNATVDNQLVVNIPIIKVAKNLTLTASVKGLPQSAALSDSANGKVLTWTPTAADVNSTGHDVFLQLFDDQGRGLQKQFKIKVNPR